MKRIVTVLAFANLVAILPTAASAGNWTTINQRQASLMARIDKGVRAGSLTRREADGLKAKFNAIARQEEDYRRSGHGLSLGEQKELDHQFDMLSREIFDQKHDAQVRR